MVLHHLFILSCQEWRSTKEIERYLGVTYKTAWRMAKHVRALMLQDSNPLSGVIETDETYIGGRERGKHVTTQNKAVIFGMVERDGKVKAEHVPTAGARVLLPRIHNAIQIGSTVYSDHCPTFTFARRG